VTAAEWPRSRRGDNKCESLLVLQDKAGPLMDARTPLDALIAIYDLLEGNFVLFSSLVQTLTQ
jgi:hypothetical protein